MILFPIDRLDAVIFDMDGVVSDTARVHERCWKLVFDDFLRSRPDRGRRGPSAVRLKTTTSATSTANPATTVWRASLPPVTSRSHAGAPSDPPGHGTVCALGNLKDRDFERAVAEDGVTLFDSTIAFLRTLRAHGSGRP